MVLLSLPLSQSVYFGTGQRAVMVCGWWKVMPAVTKGVTNVRSPVRSHPCCQIYACSSRCHHQCVACFLPQLLHLKNIFPEIYFGCAVHTCTCQVSSHVPGEKWTSLHLSTKSFRTSVLYDNQQKFNIEAVNDYSADSIRDSNRILPIRFEPKFSIRRSLLYAAVNLKPK